jgi:hypothetical protein
MARFDTEASERGLAMADESDALYPETYANPMVKALINQISGGGGQSRNYAFDQG